MGSFSQGVETGLKQDAVNPFNVILSKISESQARRYKEDQDRKKEEGELSKALMVLSYKDNYDRALQQEKAKADKEQATTEAENKRKNILLEGMAGGKISPTTETGEGTFEGTPFGAVGERFKTPASKPSVEEQKFAIEQKDKEKQQIEKSQFVKDSATDTLNTIKTVEEGIGNFGVTGSIPSIPGTKRANWEANVNKLLSSNVIKLMTQMKEASKTGATGFGQLSEKELKVLQEASTALKRNLSPKDAQKYLNDMKSAAQKILGEQAQNNDPEYQKYLTAIGQ